MIEIIKRLKNNKFLLNSLFVLIGISITKVFLLLLNFFLASILTSNDFGVFSIIRSSSSTFVSILWYPLNIAIITQIASYKGDRQRVKRLLTFIFRFIFVLILCSIVISFVFSDVLISYLFKNNITFLEYYLILGLFITSFLTSIFIGVFVGLEETKWIVDTNIKSLIAVLFLVVLSFNYSYVGAIIGLMIYYLLQLFFYLRKIFSLFDLAFNVKTDFIEFKQQFLSFKKIGVPLLMITIVTNLTYYFLKILVFVELSPSSLAVYELADQWSVMVSTILAAIVMPIIPQLIKVSFSEKFKIKYALVLLTITTLFLIFGYFSSLYVERLFVSKFKGLNELVVYLLVGTIPYSMFLLLDKVLIAKSYPWKSFLGYLALVVTMLLYIYSNEFSIFIVAKSILISNIAGMLVLFLLEKQKRDRLWI